MPLVSTRGAASAQGFGEFAQSAPANYIEDVFSTWLYTGNGSTQTITNGIDLTGKGGLVWLKNRGAVANHLLFWQPTSSPWLSSNTTSVAGTLGAGNEFTSSGFSLNGSSSLLNASGNTYASWTFRKQPKFFDVVTWTGDGVDNRVIPHALGTMPGCVITKNCDSTNTRQSWCVMHKDAGFTYSTGAADGNQLWLNRTDAAGSDGSFYSFNSASSTALTIPSGWNISGNLYVAYLFAHNAGGFGLTGTDNVISCGSMSVTAGGDATVTLGYEPQWVLFKRTDGTGGWAMFDNMRGWASTGTALLRADLSSAESNYGATPVGNPTATGFTLQNFTSASGSTYIYIAIRRGPMKVPTTGTSVFTPVAYTGNGGTQIATTGFPVDAMIEFERTNASGVPVAGGKYMTDRLRGSSAYLETSGSSAEGTGFVFGLTNNTGVALSTYFNTSSRTYIIEAFRRAPGFMDEVCFTGTGSARTVAHNLAAVPELLFVKSRSNTQNWGALCTLNSGLQGRLNTTDALEAPSAAVWGSGGVYVSPTASVFTVGNDNETNASGWTYVAYLFATCPGVSKVGSFTGTGATQVINCGFTGGARFVLIKATSTTGNWLVWDSARGIVSGNDPYLALNSTAAEVTNTDWVDTAATGFELSNAGGNLANSNGVSYIFLAIS
jgi:hypothetical protein